MLNPVEHHRKHHYLADGTLPRMKTCFRCVTAKARCAGKLDFKSRDLADRAALRINIERGWFPGECLKAYRCRYCRVWHLTCATRRVDIERVEKMRRKWLRRTHQRDFGIPEADAS